MNLDNIKMAVFDCPFALPGPDLLITVNFTTLGINATFPSNSILSAVSIVVGLHMSTLDVIHNTWPIPLFPDAHLHGGVIRTVREQFKGPVLASLGFTSDVCPFSLCFLLMSLLSHVATPDKGVLYMCCPIPVPRLFLASSSRQQHCHTTPVPTRRLL